MARAILEIGRVLVALALLSPLAASAQETPDQFNAANAESRRYNEVQNQLRNQAHDLRNDRANGLLQCQGTGSAAAQNACANNLDTNLRRRGLDLNNQRIQQQNDHSLILKGIGVHRVP
jgi:flavoprotein